MFTTEPLMTNSIFEQELAASNYIYDRQVGAWMKEDSNGDLHTYMHVDHRDWIYEKYDINDVVLESKPFTLV